MTFKTHTQCPNNERTVLELGGAVPGEALGVALGGELPGVEGDGLHVGAHEPAGEVRVLHGRLLGGRRGLGGGRRLRV